MSSFLRRVLPAAVVFSFLLIFADIGAATEAVDSAAEIVSVQGQGEFRQDEGKDWLDAKAKQKLFSGDHVRTGIYSRMGILFRDKTQIRLNQKTLLRIKSVLPQPGTGGDTVLQLNRGRAWTKTKTLPAGLIMETPSATAAIRGTDWDIEVDDNGTSTLTVLSGEVEFYNNLGRVTLGKNEQARAEVGKAPVKLIIVQPRDRIQWVTAYAVEPLRHIYLYKSELAFLKQALATIRGDSADELARKGSILADMGQWELAEENFQAALAVDAGNALALVGQGYVALHKGETVEAEKYFVRVSASPKVNELVALGRITIDLQLDQLSKAVSQLQNMLSAGGLAQPAAYLILSDLMIYTGDLEQASNHARQALQSFPDNALAYSQLARIFLFSDKTTEAQRSIELALAGDENSYEANVAQGDLARIQGDANGALNAYQCAVNLNPGDDRAWHGLGVVNTEREDVAAARRNLATALSIKPTGSGYQGERGTLEAFANNFVEAETAFAQALTDIPGDYVALTGLGIMQLKRGNTEAALDSFLRAGLMEPRYARVRMYTGVAYYQLGNVAQALEELYAASELDRKDPMPYLLASIIYTDLLRPGDAIEAARKAFELMPNLKSLNQLANTQRGTTNLGQAFAFMGMEDWSQMYAQDSYDPFWAGSHLFLADRYNGLFVKNSELFQGFMADPTAFGAGNRYQTLIQRPGNYVSASLRATTVKGGDDEIDGTSPFVEVNGFDNKVVPFAYYLAYENMDLSFDSGPYDTDTYSLALGMNPAHNLGVFLYADHSKLDTGIDKAFPGITFDTDERLISGRTDLGIHYKFSPASQIWFKSGFFRSDDHVDGFLSGEALDMQVDVKLPEYAFRHTFRLRDKHEISWGYEYAQRETQLLYDKFDYFSSLYFDTPIFNIFDQDYSEKSSDLYVSDRFTILPELQVQLDLFYQHNKRKAHEDFLLNFPLIPFKGLVGTEDDDFSDSQLNPRLGLVYKFGNKKLIRLAYQDWLRPASFSSLGPIATAGIPLDDRLVSRGGEFTRYRGQFEWEVTPETFTSVFLDYKKINNNLFSVTTPYTINDLEGLGKLRKRDLGALTKDDLLEFVNTPAYEGGNIKSAGVSVNHLLNKHCGVFGKYIHALSENSGTAFNGNDVPYLPNNAGAVGVTWTSPSGWYFVSRMVYRSERYSDEGNTVKLAASWDGAADIYWQSKEKHWLLRFSVDDAFDENQGTQYTAEVNFRF